MRLTGSTVLVTGASAGIGAATSALLAARRARVLVHGRDETRTADVAVRIGAVPLLADLTTATGVDRLADSARAQAPVDVLVACAGRGHSGPFTAMTPDEIDDVLALDLTGVLRLAHRLLPGMVERGTGHLCFVSSIAGRTGVAGEAVYAAAKAGLDAFADSLRLELVGTGVGVSVVVPGVVDTGFFAARGRPYDRRSPRPVSAETVAKAIVATIEHDRAEAYVPGWLRLAPAVRAVAPGSFRTLSRRFGEKVRVR